MLRCAKSIANMFTILFLLSFLGHHVSSLATASRQRLSTLQSMSMSLGAPPSAAFCAYILFHAEQHSIYYPHPCTNEALREMKSINKHIVKAVGYSKTRPLSELDLAKCSATEIVVRKNLPTLTDEDKQSCISGGVCQFCQTYCRDTATVLSADSGIAYQAWVTVHVSKCTDLATESFGNDVSVFEREPRPRNAVDFDVYPPLLADIVPHATQNVLSTVKFYKDEFLGQTFQKGDVSKKIKKTSDLVGLVYSGALVSETSSNHFAKYFSSYSLDKCAHSGYSRAFASGTHSWDRQYTFSTISRGEGINVVANAYTFDLPADYGNLPDPDSDDICVASSGPCSAVEGAAVVPFKGYAVGTSFRTACGNNYEWLLNAYESSLRLSFPLDVVSSSDPLRMRHISLIRSSIVHTPFIARQFLNLMATSISQQYPQANEVPQITRVLSLSLVGMGHVEKRVNSIVEDVMARGQHQSLPDTLAQMQSEIAARESSSGSLSDSVSQVVKSMNLVHMNLIASDWVYSSTSFLNQGKAAELEMNMQAYLQICEWMVESLHFPEGAGYSIQCSEEGLRKYAANPAPSTATRAAKLFQKFLEIEFASKPLSKVWRGHEFILLSAILIELGVHVGINCKSGLDRTAFVHAVFTAVYAAYISFPTHLETLSKIKDVNWDTEMETFSLNHSPELVIAEFQNFFFRSLMEIGWKITTAGTGLMGFKWHGNVANPHPAAFMPKFVKWRDGTLKTRASLTTLHPVFKNLILGASSFRGS